MEHVPARGPLRNFGRLGHFLTLLSAARLQAVPDFLNGPASAARGYIAIKCWRIDMTGVMGRGGESPAAANEAPHCSLALSLSRLCAIKLVTEVRPISR